MIRPVVILLALLLAAVPAWAQSPAPPTAASVARANAWTVGLVSGGVDGTYIRIAADLAAVLDDGDQLRVLPVLGKGSISNLSDILYLRGIDIGIVQSDALAYVQKQKTFPGIEHSIQYIAKLYDEEVHVLARQNIAQLQDLAGQTVNVDLRGSGTAMTASVLFDTLGISAKTANDDQNTALEKLKRGEIAALVYVAGSPARLFANLPAANGLHFLPVPVTAPLLETYLPSRLSHSDYPALVPEGTEVDTIAVGAVMAVFAWQPGTDRYRKVARFVDAFFDKFPLFLVPPRHPKWKEVNLAATIPGWTRFPEAEAWLRVHNGDGSELRSAFNTFLSQTGAVRPDMSDSDRNALFQQFLAWQNRRQSGR